MAAASGRKNHRKNRESNLIRFPGVFFERFNLIIAFALIVRRMNKYRKKTIVFSEFILTLHSQFWDIPP